jgi:predicted nucleic acid-binding Zn finger protein
MNPRVESTGENEPTFLTRRSKMAEFKVKSKNSDHTYVVVCEGERKAWKCSCPHWMFRLRKSGVACKHIVQMQEWEKQHDALEAMDWTFSLEVEENG